MDDVTRVHEVDALADLHHVQFAETFRQDEIVVDDAFEQFAAVDPVTRRRDGKRERETVRPTNTVAFTVRG
jgi:hypothetical protein